MPFYEISGENTVGPMAFHVGIASTKNNNIESKILEVLDYLSVISDEEVAPLVVGNIIKTGSERIYKISAVEGCSGRNFNSGGIYGGCSKQIDYKIFL